MPKEATHITFIALLQYHISRYYLRVQKLEKSSPRTDQQTHYNFLLELETLYQKDLKKHEQRDAVEFDYEQQKEMFRRHMDFLTNVFSKQDKENALQERKEELKKHLKSTYRGK